MLLKNKVLFRTKTNLGLHGKITISKFKLAVCLVTKESYHTILVPWIR